MGALATGLFSGTAAAYTLAACAYLLLLLRRDLGAVARWSGRLAWLLHTVALGAVIWHTRRLPVYSLFESVLLIAWLMSSAYVMYEFNHRTQAVGTVVLPLVCGLAIASLVLPKAGLLQDTYLTSYLTASLVAWHVVVLLLGYGCFACASVANLLYLLQERQLRAKRFRGSLHTLPSLEALDIWGHRSVTIGFALLTLGLGAGLIFARLRWGTFGLEDPKVLWSLFTWALYGGYLGLRRTYGWGGRRAAIWCLSGFAALVVNLLIINLFLSPLHSFGM